MDTSLTVPLICTISPEALRPSNWSMAYPRSERIHRRDEPVRLCLQLLRCVHQPLWAARATIPIATENTEGRADRRRHFRFQRRACISLSPGPLAGATSCDVIGGGPPKLYIYNRGCTMLCTAEHENVHVKQLIDKTHPVGACCAKAKAAYKNATRQTKRSRRS